MAKVMVIIESPFKGAYDLNADEALDYTRRCCMDSMNRGEAPLASHLFYPISAGGFLDDDVPEERDAGIWAGRQWLIAAQLVAVYADFGVTEGMQVGINRAQRKNVQVEFRSLASSDYDDKNLTEVRKLPSQDELS